MKGMAGQERVAELVPALALTTSVPASWILWVRLRRVSLSRERAGEHWERRGRMVAPAWPPTTGQVTRAGSSPWRAPTNSLLLATSSVVTPNSFLGLYTPAILKTSATMGTVELTGLVMTAIMAVGQTLAAAAARVATMEALVTNRSSLVIPALLGTPAAMTTISAPSRADSSSSAPTYLVTLALVSMCERSTATLG